MSAGQTGAALTLATFESPKFDPVHWVNGLLSQADAAHGPTSDPIAATLGELTSAMAKAHSDLDHTFREAVSVVPWAVREVETVRLAATSLRAGVDGVGERVAGVEGGAADAVASIAQADAVVRRVESARDLLRRVNDTTRLSDRLDGLFVGGDLPAVADAISVLREDLLALRTIRELDPLREALSHADTQLEDAAAPKLAVALQARDIPATNVSRKVFGRSGRAGAFEHQYLQVRSDQILDLWVQSIRHCLSDNYRVPPAHPVDNTGNTGTTGTTGTAAPTTLPAGLALTDPTAPEILHRFYDRVGDMIRAESAWTREALPDLRDGLLVQLVPHALRQLKPPLLATTDPSRHIIGSRQPTPPEVLYAAFQNAKVACKFGKALCETLAKDSEPNPKEIATALGPVLLPVTFFLRNLGFLEAQSAEYAIDISLYGLEQQSPTASTLSDCSNKIEAATQGILDVADATIQRCIEQSNGTSVKASLQALTKCASIIISRVSALIQKAKTTEDDMHGSLRLLSSIAVLARLWAEKRDILIGESVSRAASLLEKASGECSADDATLLECLLATSDTLHFGLMYVHCKEQDLVASAVSSLGQDYSFASDQTAGINNELGRIVRLAQELVYESMFAYVRVKLTNMPNMPDWASKGDLEGMEEDEMAEFPAFSNAPLNYAVEVGEHLMTIPQQLEPFVPEDIDAPLSSPSNPSFFNLTAGASSTEDDLYESGGAHFARRWISAIGSGTMDVLLANICKISRLEKHGVVQLATDVEYLSNVLGALGVSPSSGISLVRELLDVDISELSVTVDRLTEPVDISLANHVAKIRMVNSTTE